MTQSVFRVVPREPHFYYAISWILWKNEITAQRKDVNHCRSKTGKDIVLTGRYPKVTVEQME